MSTSQNRVKIWLLGPEHTGKSTMLSTLLSGSAVHNYKQTQQPELSLFRAQNLELYILDTPGCPVYDTITKAHLDRQDAAGVILTFDITSKESLAEMKKHISLWRRFDKARPQHKGLLPVAIVGMKRDLVNRRVVTQKQGDALEAKLKKSMGAKNVRYFEASIKEQASVQEVYAWLAERVTSLNGQTSTQGVLRMMDDPSAE